VASYRVILSSMAISMAVLSLMSLMLIVDMELKDSSFLIASSLVMKFLLASITRALPISYGMSEGACIVLSVPTSLMAVSVYFSLTRV